MRASSSYDALPYGTADRTLHRRAAAPQDLTSEPPPFQLNPYPGALTLSAATGFVGGALGVPFRVPSLHDELPMHGVPRSSSTGALMGGDRLPYIKLQPSSGVSSGSSGGVGVGSSYGGGSSYLGGGSYGATYGQSRGLGHGPAVVPALHAAYQQPPSPRSSDPFAIHQWPSPLMGPMQQLLLEQQVGQPMGYSGLPKASSNPYTERTAAARAASAAERRRSAMAERSRAAEVARRRPRRTRGSTHWEKRALPRRRPRGAGGGGAARPWRGGARPRPSVRPRPRRRRSA